jgi:uncharacterized protein YjgD (DUF1641 family)
MLKTQLFFKPPQTSSVNRGVKDSNANINNTSNSLSSEQQSNKPDYKATEPTDNRGIIDKLRGKPKNIEEAIKKIVTHLKTYQPITCNNHSQTQNTNYYNKLYSLIKDAEKLSPETDIKGLLDNLKSDAVKQQPKDIVRIQSFEQYYDPNVASKEVKMARRVENSRGLKFSLGG